MRKREMMLFFHCVMFDSIGKEKESTHVHQGHSKQLIYISQPIVGLKLSETILVWTARMCHES